MQNFIKNYCSEANMKWVQRISIGVICTAVVLLVTSLLLCGLFGLVFGLVFEPDMFYDILLGLTVILGTYMVAMIAPERYRLIGLGVSLVGFFFLANWILEKYGA